MKPAYFHPLNRLDHMQRIKPEVDIIMDVLESVLKAQPDSSFTQSLLRQYQERGGLSKKQLQGLHGKASKLNELAPQKLATLEAIIKKKPNRYKSAMLLPDDPPTRDENAGKMIDDILGNYPQHKRVLFFKTKFENNEVLSNAEISELQKFVALLLK